MSPKHNSDNTDSCVESDEWSPVPTPTPTSLALSVQDVYTAGTAYYPTWKAATKMAFHMVGCSGNDQDLTPQQQVANAMVTQIASPNTPTSVQTTPVVPS